MGERNDDAIFVASNLTELRNFGLGEKFLRLCYEQRNQTELWKNWFFSVITYISKSKNV